METAIIGKNAKRIRHAQELTQAQVANQAGISVPTYSKVESGKTSPRMETVYKIAKSLNVTVQELLSPVKELTAVRFRAQKKLKRRDHILAKASRWLEDFNYLLEAEGQDAPYTLSDIPSALKRISPARRAQEAASRVRQRMGLDDEEPIHDMTGLLAANGIRVFTYELASDGFFGMSITEVDGGPAIVVNVWNRIRVERWIFSAAHELGHLMLHLEAYNVRVEEEDKAQEKEANLFAAHFLMPQQGFEKEWNETRGLAFLDRVLKTKRIFHVSYKTVLYRLIELGRVDDTVWESMNKRFKHLYGPRRPSKFEPEGLQRYDFRTDWLERLVRLAVERQHITQSRASEILGISLPEMKSRIASWVEERVAS
jgi:Zn-dependent peptidase ImmA (M78 family)/DNA-binding XRE family transcriptional regulator